MFRPSQWQGRKVALEHLLCAELWLRESAPAAILPDPSDIALLLGFVQQTQFFLALAGGGTLSLCRVLPACTVATTRSRVAWSKSTPVAQGFLRRMTNRGDLPSNFKKSLTQVV
jgi:hypothetical protein